MKIKFWKKKQKELSKNYKKKDSKYIKKIKNQKNTIPKSSMKVIINKKFIEKNITINII